jgi:multisubunit Na+/H+ antiporter MnhE subunit
MVHLNQERLLYNIILQYIIWNHMLYQMIWHYIVLYFIILFFYYVIHLCKAEVDVAMAMALKFANLG